MFGMILEGRKAKHKEIILYAAGGRVPNHLVQLKLQARLQSRVEQKVAETVMKGFPMWSRFPTGQNISRLETGSTLFYRLTDCGKAATMAVANCSPFLAAEKL
jgi:hypothetical protein